MNIACVGEMVIDFLPGKGEGVYIRKPGGAPANVAVAVARNALKAGFCGCLGNDDFGRFLLKTLTDNHVEVLRPELLDEAITTMAFVTLDENNNRSFTFVRKPGADQFLSKKDIDRGGVVRADLIHAGSCSLSKSPASEATVYALECARENKKLISFDINYRNLMWEDDRAACIRAVQKLLPLVDLLKLSEEERDMLGVEPSEAGEVYGIAVVVETLGASGARCFWHGKELTVAGRKARCVDATGAGDAFWGGFISYLLRNQVITVQDITEALLQKALEYGNVAGWLCVQKKGAMESLPTFSEIEAILEVEHA